MFNNRVLKQHGLHSEAGFSLIEVVMAAGIFCILFAIGASLLSYVRNVSANTAFITTRSAIMTDYKQKIGAAIYLRASASKAENLQFKNCVCGGAAACASGIATPFSLYEPNEPGPKTQFQYFDANGQHCPAETAPSCLIRVTTTFTAQCMPALPSSAPMPPANCNIPAEFVAVTLLLERNPQAPGTSNQFKPVQSTSYTPTSTVGVSGDGLCP